MDNKAELHLNVKKTMRELRSLAKNKVEKVDSVNLVSEEKVKIEVKSSQRLDDNKKKYSKRYTEASRRLEDESTKRDKDSWREESYIPTGWKRRRDAFLPQQRKERKARTWNPLSRTYNVSYSPADNYDVEHDNQPVIESEEKLKEKITETVYQEGNTDVDP